jgi:nitrite reductase/ring-hydroxylating ferredoxin subunit
MSDAPVTRRRFFAHAGAGCLGAALAAAGLEASLAALPVSFVEGRGTAREKSYPIPATDGVSIDRSVAVILVRSQGRMFALDQTCPHQNAAVKWLEGDGRFQCSKHDSKYRPDGTYIAGRSTRNMDRLAVSRAADAVVVDLDRVFRADEDPEGWAAAVVDL